MKNNATKPTERFTHTVQDYLKYRPSYPKKVLEVLVKECDLTQDKIIADIGSGTGFLSKLFLDYGSEVYGVEPNKVMREAGETYLKEYPRFHSVPGTAEATTLKKQSINMVTAGTAFHWFNAKKAKVEFKRILKPNGWVLLVWNVRNLEESSFMQDYENLIIEYGSDYSESNAKKFEKTVDEDFFHPHEMKMKVFAHSQRFDWEGLRGRLLSASYSLRSGDARFEEMLQTLKKIFDKHQSLGAVEFLYLTKLYYGQL